MKCNCILAGIDLGAETESILAYAAYFSDKSGADLRLLYVLDYLLTPPAYLAPYIEGERSSAESAIAKWQAVLQKKGIRSEKTVVIGRLHESFLKSIHEFSPELLIIGYRTHALRPSSSEKLIRSLSLPMLVVRGKKSVDASIGSIVIRNILCAIDFSEGSFKAFSIACRCVEKFGAKLQLIHAVPTHLIKQRVNDAGLSGNDDVDKFESDLFAQSDKAFFDMLRKINLTVPYVTVAGDPIQMICAYGDRGGYDLIVMGARGLSFMESVILGSTTEGVLKSSSCPVLVVR